MPEFSPAFRIISEEKLMLKFGSVLAAYSPNRNTNLRNNVGSLVAWKFQLRFL